MGKDSKKKKENNSNANRQLFDAAATEQVIESNSIMAQFVKMPTGTQLITLFLFNTALVFLSGIATLPWLTEYDKANDTANGDNVLSITVATVYFQVIAGFMLQYMSLNFFDGGPNALLFATFLMLLTFAKHIFADDLIPPKAMMVLSVGLTASLIYSESIGRKAFIAFHGLNALAFFYNPQTPLLATFPHIAPGSDTHRIGLHFFEVFAVMEVVIAWMALQNSSKECLAYSFLLVFTAMAWHAVDGSRGPPVPVVFFCGEKLRGAKRRATNMIFKLVIWMR
ncbi:hypothetical protein TL16_g12946 [Triparma laevis f. inornata]|uniref:Uncharacterized protein n=1 Tax=Triparma laevis f. inornata TaxID=1714386 RepID=A0A9W7EYM0_9STRA|nr:hypothetical protein TL16_g12946 [Triparma laevis f. inornata]